MGDKRKRRNWMAIKLDLEKAYDRVSWDFINTSLIAAIILIFLRNVIMPAIFSASMQILWNGVPTQKFKPVRGIRQGCPLSPYLFVLCMEWLGHLIRAEVEKENWDPICLSHKGPEISHLFFADDLFCEISGHRVSAGKSNIFFSKSTGDDVQKQISQLLGFQKVQNLGTYLGVPLLYDRITRNTLSFVVDKVRRKLQNWDAMKLSTVGRITLA
ncbi:hypothetical protein J1N35_015586 [Gossypium stocksii]|uniref:Reverse transcriptase domain-containing protein n=1 Tax=Gossypium stocksii TaxID=47602 RepID=A0A9D3VWH4_9ROSI|nr:hypothetical protein J1N35_015586 [Gossypium stocksii]